MSDYMYHNIMKYVRGVREVIARQKREIANLQKQIELREKIDKMKEESKNDEQ